MMKNETPSLMNSLPKPSDLCHLDLDLRRIIGFGLNPLVEISHLNQLIGSVVVLQSMKKLVVSGQSYGS